MWIRTKDNEVLETKSVIYKNGEPVEFTWIGNYKSCEDGSATIEAKRFTIDKIAKYGEKIEDTCGVFEGDYEQFQCLPVIYCSKYDYNKFDRDMDLGVATVYGGYMVDIDEGRAEFIAYCKYNRAKRCFEQIETKRIYE